MNINLYSNKALLFNSNSNTKFFCTNNNNKVNITFNHLGDNTTKTVEAEVGESLLDIAHNHEIDLEGACDSSLACSTCHCILEQKIYDKIPEATEEEDDLLDMAFGLDHTSRLGCQVKVDKSFEGTIVNIPSATVNMYVDGHKPKPH